MDMKKVILNTVLVLILAIFFISCSDNKSKTFEEKMEQKSDDLENRSDDLEDRSDDYEDASEHIEEATNNIEVAMNNFRDALKEMDNPEDRRAVRKRINALLDSLEIQKRGSH